MRAAERCVMAPAIVMSTGNVVVGEDLRTRFRK
jgi:hypothetical protein